MARLGFCPLTVLALACLCAAETSERQLSELETYALAAEAADERSASASAQYRKRLARDHKDAIQKTSAYAGASLDLGASLDASDYAEPAHLSSTKPTKKAAVTKSQHPPTQKATAAKDNHKHAKPQDHAKKAIQAYRATHGSVHVPKHQKIHSKSSEPKQDETPNQTNEAGMIDGSKPQKQEPLKQSSSADGNKADQAGSVHASKPENRKKNNDKSKVKLHQKTQQKDVHKHHKVAHKDKKEAPSQKKEALKESQEDDDLQDLLDDFE